MRGALRHRGFRALWLAQLVSRAGDSLHEVALVWLVFAVTGDPAVLALTVAASALPTALGSVPAGGLIDRVDRRTVLVGVSLARGGLVLAIPLVGRGPWLVPTVLGVAAVTGLLEAAAGPARGALLPRVVPEADLDGANALLELTASAGRLLYIAGGAAVALIGPFAAFYLDAASFLLAAGCLLGVPAGAGRPDRAVEPGWGLRRALGEFRAGVGYVRRHRLLPAVCGLSLAMTLVLAPLAVVLPYYVERLDAGAGGFGLLYGGVYAGVLVGAVALGAFDRRVAANRGRVIVVGVGTVGLGLIGAAAVPGRAARPVPTAAVAFLAVGIAFAAVNAPVRSLVQTAVPDDRRGRTFAVLGALTLPAIPLGALLAAPVLAGIGPAAFLAGQGVGLLLIGGALARSPIVGVGTGRGARVGARKPG